MPTLEICCNNSDVKSFYENRSNYEADSGIDLYVTQDFVFKPGETILVNLGVKTRLVYDTNTTMPYYLYPRSSIYKTPLRLANSVGIIDKDYRGNICAALTYVPTQEVMEYLEDPLGNNARDINCFNYTLLKGTRIVQICEPTLKPISMKLVEELDSTERGDGGFGSTGV